VVASKIRGTDEIIRDGVTGVLIPEFDPDVYASTILMLLKDPDLRARMGKAGQDDVRRRFLRTRSTAEHLEIYESLLPLDSNSELNT